MCKGLDAKARASALFLAFWGFFFRPPLSGAAAHRAVQRKFAAAHLEPITRVHGFDIKNFASREAKHAFYGRGHVFVHSVGKLDNDNRAFPRRADQSANYRTRSPAELSEHNLHNGHASTRHCEKRKGLCF